MPKSDWSRSLPRSITIPKVMMLKTIADVRELIRHIPAERRKASTWKHVQATLREGNPKDDVSVVLRMVLQLEGVPYSVSK